MSHSVMSDSDEPSVNRASVNKVSGWKRYRMPIILGIVAVLLYAGSIVWMIYGRGQVA